MTGVDFSDGAFRLRIARVCGVALMLLLAVPVRADLYRLRDGRTIDAATTVIREGKLVLEVAAPGERAAEVALPLALVASIEAPEPEELIRARRALEAGRAAEARVDAETVSRRFAPFPRTPGSWWADAEVVILRALAAMGREGEVQKAAAALRSASSLTPRQLAQVSFAVAIVDARTGRKDAARAALELVLRDDPTPGVECEAALLLADLWLDAGAWERALDCVLRVPAFHGNRTDLMPRVHLLSARAYRGLRDAARVERAVFALTDEFGGSREAAVARNEFKSEHQAVASPENGASPTPGRTPGLVTTPTAQVGTAPAASPNLGTPLNRQPHSP